jgi:hypothetical protein
MTEKMNLDELIQELLNNPDKINELDVDTIEKVSKKMSVYGQLTHEPKQEFVSFSLVNLKEKFIQGYSMLSLVGFVYKMLEEYSAIEDDKKVVIKDFLDSLFSFNPDFHAKSQSDKEVPKTELIPTNVPADTFHRWNNYLNMNYEQYRELTEKLYKYKPDLDFVINVYDTFDTIDETKEFNKKYQTELLHDVLTTKTNTWCFLGSFKENREKVDFYNKNTEVLEEILKQTEKDSKIGQELLKKRVTNTKKREIRKYGVDSNKIESVFNKAIDDASKLCDIKEASDLNKQLDPFLPRDFDDIKVNPNVVPTRDSGSNCPDNQVQVDVWTTSMDGAELKKSKIYTQAIAPEEPRSSS